MADDAAERANAATADERRFNIPLSDGSLAALRWGRGNARILFCHATGFCASAYRQMCTALAAEFEVTAIDMRGHGRTTAVAEPESLKDWSAFASDISAAIDWLQAERPGPLTLAGHSLGAVTGSMAAAGRRDIERLALVEPVAHEPPVWLRRLPLWPLAAARLPMVKAARNRRDYWPTRAAVLGRYRQKPIFQAWAPGCLEDYLDDGLREAADGVGLSCAKNWEAAIFASIGSHLWPALSAAPAPVRILVANERDTTAPPRARRRFARLGATVERFDSAGHLAPFEAPEAVAAFIARAAAS